MTRLVLATGNRGKVREMAALLADLGLEVVAQDELGVVPAEETGTTFVANALLKARHAAAVTGFPALADDSGLEVDALCGAPGVYSARYAGPAATDAANNDKLLAALVGCEAPRLARYRCVLAFVRDAADPEPLVAIGSWEGEIGRAPRGSGGFGYDPLFLVAGDPAGRTAALLDPVEKNRVSHRAKALAELREGLARRLALAGGPS